VSDNISAETEILSANINTKANVQMSYMYADYLSEIQSCPPQSAIPRNVTAWRWTFNPHSNKCFLPVAELEPKRLLTNSDRTKCSLWALSMFETKSQAIDKMRKLDSSIPGFKATKGDHVSTVDITQADGVAEVTDKFGHFNFHPCEDFDMLTNSKINGPIP